LIVDIAVKKPVILLGKSKRACDCWCAMYYVQAWHEAKILRAQLFWTWYLEQSSWSSIQY